MTIFPRQPRSTLPIASLVAAVLAIVVALSFAALPGWMIDAMAVDSGIAAAVAGSQLGLSARAMLALVGGGMTGACAWLAIVAMLGARHNAIGRAEPEADEIPVLRRADAHPDAPARRPVFAHRDLGTPFLDVQARAIDEEEADALARTIPTDLDLRLAAFDPAAIPGDPADGFLPPAQLIHPPRHARPATLVPIPSVGPAPRPESALASLPDQADGPIALAAARPGPPPVDSIDALLDRLERGVLARESPVVSRGGEAFDDATSAPRRLATRH